MDALNHLNLAWIPLLWIVGGAVGAGISWVATRRRP